ncbi:hypothetical protein CN481_15580 [Bacillus sp. AFS006103]|nr:hypothetical protein CN481_15580 [Bacillus sp. AFS006103]
MKKYLSKKERKVILSRLSDNQKNALFSAVSTSYKSYFANILAEFKGTRKWTFVKYIDHETIQDNVKCMCGKKLRHEFIMQHDENGEKRSIGIVHLQEELKMPDDIARRVLRGIHRINYDLDEILYKWYIGFVPNKFIKKYWSELQIKEEIRILNSAELPLLERHEKELIKQIKNLGNERKTNHNPYTDLNIITRKILLNKIDTNDYFNKFWPYIEGYIKKRNSFVPLTVLFGILVTSRKIPNDYFQGKQVLLPYFKQYLLSKNELITKKDNLDNIRFKHKNNIKIKDPNNIKLEIEFKGYDINNEFNKYPEINKNTIYESLESVICSVSLEDFNPIIRSLKEIKKNKYLAILTLKGYLKTDIDLRNRIVNTFIDEWYGEAKFKITEVD